MVLKPCYEKDKRTWMIVLQMFHAKWYNDILCRIANEQDFFNEHKNVYNESWSELVKSEIFRQRDKSNNNSIGYFHQRMFQYISGCRVPDNGKEGGWDVIYENSNGIILPDVIAEVIKDGSSVSVPKDTVLEELSNIAKNIDASSEELSMAMAMYLLGFSSYSGFAKSDDENMINRIYEYAKRIAESK